MQGNRPWRVIPGYSPALNPSFHLLTLILLRYLAPETLQGRFTKACDVFSLGITMLELACDLDLPRHGDLWQKIRMEGPDPASTMHLQPELRRVLLIFEKLFHNVHHPGSPDDDDQ